MFKIKFDESLRIRNTLSDLNSSMIDIYIEKAPEEKPENLNLTWEVEKFEEYEVTIQMTFESPSAISTPTEIQDKLVFHIREEGQNLFTSEKNRRLDPLKHTMKRKIKRQMGNTALNRGIGSSAEGGEMSLKIILIFTFFMNLLLSGSMQYFTMMIRAL